MLQQIYFFLSLKVAYSRFLDLCISLIVDDQNVDNSWTESTPQFVDVSIHVTENSESTKNRSNASENADFRTIIVNLVKKAIIAAGFIQPEGPFLKIRSKMMSFIFKNLLPFCNCITNHYYFVIKLITFLSSIDRRLLPDLLVKCLTHTIPTSMKPKERDEAILKN